MGRAGAGDDLAQDRGLRVRSVGLDRRGAMVHANAEGAYHLKEREGRGWDADPGWALVSFNEYAPPGSLALRYGIHRCGLPVRNNAGLETNARLQVPRVI